MPAKRKSAFSAALRAAQQQHGETVPPSSSEAVSQQGSETVRLLDSSTVTQQSSEAVKPLNSETDRLSYRETAGRLHSNTVTQSHSKTVKKERKISFYLTPEQESKLYALEIGYYQHTGKRINRNDIVRCLVDQADVDSLIERLDLHK